MEKKLTETIIGFAMKVHNALGIGFLEKVYENALMHELVKAGFNVKQQDPVPVIYDGVIVGDYITDLIVDGKILIELKCIAAFAEVHTAICLNYLRATNLPICLLINFGKPRLDWKRLAGGSYANYPEVL